MWTNPSNISKIKMIGVVKLARVGIRFDRCLGFGITFCHQLHFEGLALISYGFRVLCHVFSEKTHISPATTQNFWLPTSEVFYSDLG